MLYEDDEIARLIKAKIADYDNKANVLRDALKVIENGGESKADVIKVVNKKPKGGTVSKLTFATWINEQFKDGVPKLSRTLMNTYNKEHNKDFDISGFSGKLSAAAKRGLVKKHEILSNPIESRYYYAIPSFFSGDELKHEYLERIK